MSEISGGTVGGCPEGQTAYTISAGDTFYFLARRYNVTAESIQAANPKVNPNNLQIGQVICIPEVPVKTCPDGTSPYTVRAGDTFYNLARTYGITVQSIQAANPGVNPNNLQIGQLICMPHAASVPPKEQIVPISPKEQTAPFPPKEQTVMPAPEVKVERAALQELWKEEIPRAERDEDIAEKNASPKQSLNEFWLISDKAGKKTVLPKKDISYAPSPSPFNVPCLANVCPFLLLLLLLLASPYERTDNFKHTCTENLGGLPCGKGHVIAYI